MNKFQKGLMLLLALQVVLSVVVFWPAPKTAENKALVFGDRQPSDVQAIEIQDGDGNQVHLERSSEGWVLADTDQYPADASKVDAMLADLLQVRYGRMVTQTEASQARLQVADSNYARRIQLMFASGENQILYVGSSPAAASTHFRLDGEKEVYLSDQLNTYSISAMPSAWINAALLGIRSDALQGVTLQNDSGQMVFTHSQDSAWTLEGLDPQQQANPDRINNLINEVVGLRITAPLGIAEQPAYGMAAPSASVELRLTDDQGQPQSIRLVFGRVNEDGTVVVKSSSNDHYFMVSSQTAAMILQSKLQDYGMTPTEQAPTQQP